MNKFTIDPDTSELKLLKGLDREGLSTNTKTTDKTPGNITGNQVVKINCTLARDNKTLESVKKRIRVFVTDVNDTPPTFQDEGGIQHKTDSIIVEAGEKKAVSTEDIFYLLSTIQTL